MQRDEVIRIGGASMSQHDELIRLKSRIEGLELTVKTEQAHSARLRQLADARADRIGALVLEVEGLRDALSKVAPWCRNSGWGKPAQRIGGDADGEPITIRQIITGVPRAADDEPGE